MQSEAAPHSTASIWRTVGVRCRLGFRDRGLYLPGFSGLDSLVEAIAQESPSAFFTVGMT